MIARATVADQDRIRARLVDLADRIERVRGRCPPTLEALVADRNTFDIVSYNLMLAVQICVDIASHGIADEEWPAATSLAGSFNRLRDEGVISAGTAEALVQAVSLRNVIACDYANINPAMVHAAATRGIGDLEAFAREVAARVAQRQGA